MRVPGKGDAAEFVAVSLFDRHQNIDPLALGRPQRKRVQPARVANMGGRIAGLSME